MKKFTDIGQYKDVIRSVKSHHDYHGNDEDGNAIIRHDNDYPIIKFRGTIKNHGTNSGICAYKTENGLHFEFQSRERTLSINSDNAGFMISMLRKNYQKLFDNIEFNETCVIYGEWIGSGIQKNVAITQLSKRFIIFAVRIDDVYQDMENYKHLKIEEDDIYNILQFETYYVDVDFNMPEIAQNKIVDLTISVEECCPVGKYFGVEGIGEGIVFEAYYNNNRYIFKSKGEKHAGKSKVKIINTVDDDRIKLIREIAEKVTPTWRLEQMIELSCDLMNGGFLDRTKLGEYLKLVINDVYKEDLDIILDADIEPKEINKYISEIAKNYFFNQQKL